VSKTVYRRQMARQDLVDIFRYYAREAGFSVARRFFTQTAATFSQLTGMPGMGVRYQHDHPALTGLRVFPVSSFREYLVFYRAVADGIEVIRVLHGARDIHSSLGEEFGIEENAGDENEVNEPER
jgi:toxin ParE1/3/4